MIKDAQRDIFPWMLGGLLILAAGTALATPPPTETALPSDQVWQCEVNGQKVFSDKRCGAGAAIRQLNAVNGMDAPLPLHAPRYSAGYGGPSYTPTPGYAPSPSDDSDSSQYAQNSDAVYGANQYAVIDERRRREHHPAPHGPHPPNRAAVHAHATR